MNIRNEIEKRILNNYSLTRTENENAVKQTIENARKNKEFNEAYLQIKDLEFSIAEKKFKGEDTTSEIEKLKISKIKLQRILPKLGLSNDDFLVKYNCSDCKDTGFINAEKCQCFKKKINAELIKASGLEIAKLNTFKDYDFHLPTEESHRKVLQKLKEQLLTYIEKFPRTNICNIIISGHTGVGKTFALECTTSEILKKGHTANFLTAFQLNNQFLRYHTCFDANKQSYLNILLEPDLLVIDDLGTEPMLNNVTKEYLYLVIAERMLKHKGTLISTNLTPTHIMERYGERVFSRLFDKSKSLLVKIDGSDLRRLKRS